MKAGNTAYEVGTMVRLVRVQDSTRSHLAGQVAHLVEPYDGNPQGADVLVGVSVHPEHGGAYGFNLVFGDKFDVIN